MERSRRGVDESAGGSSHPPGSKDPFLWIMSGAGHVIRTLDVLTLLCRLFHTWWYQN